jgi:hypothetical protein
MDRPKLTRRKWNALGTLLLPPSMGGKITLGPKTGPKLRDLGLVEEFETKLTGDGPAWMQITIRGWRLTSRGHVLYCEWASAHLADKD